MREKELRERQRLGGKQACEFGETAECEQGKNQRSGVSGGCDGGGVRHVVVSNAQKQRNDRAADGGKQQIKHVLRESPVHMGSVKRYHGAGQLREQKSGEKQDKTAMRLLAKPRGGLYNGVRRF